jgi:SpoIID/LytB domain protein
MERYLLGVVPYEIGTDAPLEALKAQAVAARSEAVVALRSGLYSGPNHDLTSDVECQVFAGNKKRSSRSDSAVVLTAGRDLVENGQPINAYYASNCGGMSANIAEVWPNRPRPASYITPLSDVVGSREALDFSSEDAFLDYLNGKISEDVWCNPNRGVELPDFSQRNHRWERVMSLQEFEAMMMERNPNMGAFERMEIGRRGKSGRIHQLILHYENAQEVVNTELAIRQLWKPALRSSAFIWQQEEEQIKLIGAGWGHGIGLCQSGAIAMAKTGYGYLTILQHYYPAAVLSKDE